MRISIIVPAFNEERLLAGSLHRIRVAMEALNRPGWSSELIVCDNNSTDRTAGIAREAGATVVFEPVNQISRARNTGAAHATGDWFIFVDADSHPSPQLFGEVAEAVQQGRCVAGGSTVSFKSKDVMITFLGGFWNVLSKINKWAAGSFIFCEASTFREVGGFSQELYAAEEIDLFRRLKRLARRKDRTVVVLDRYPLQTSDRKVRLYRWREIFTFIARTIIGGGRTLRSSEGCSAWYDGRR